MARYSITTRTTVPASAAPLALNGLGLRQRRCPVVSIKSSAVGTAKTRLTPVALLAWSDESSIDTLKDKGRFFRYNQSNTYTHFNTTYASTLHLRVYSPFDVSCPVVSFETLPVPNCQSLIIKRESRFMLARPLTTYSPTGARQSPDGHPWAV